ncbi:MAG: hypothetical protein EOP04_32670 [Proteobacteria bacterium]|nr:MAG: hypothetical protein EOP04_32670 [Pseudomonadota bacterium]
MKNTKEILPIIEPRDIIVGDPSARVTIMEFGDYESEACVQANEVVKEVLEKFEGKAQAAQHPLLNMLHDAFAELPDAKRKELFSVFESLFTTYKAQPEFDFEVLWKDLTSEPIIHDLAANVSKKILSNLMHKK